MSFLASATPSYPSEQLSLHLGSLSTLPIAPQVSTNADEGDAAPELQEALQALTSSKHPSIKSLEAILRSLADRAFVAETSVDKAFEVEVVTRAVTVLWSEVLRVLVENAMALEEERAWWESKLSSRLAVGTFLLQTMPIRFYRALPPRSSLSIPSLSIPSTSQLFHNPTTSAYSALGAISSPYNLTRREMLAKHKALSRARDEAARLLGNLAANGPRWDEQAEMDVNVETGRIFALVSEVLEAPLPRTNSPAATPRRSRSSMVAQPQPRPTPAPTPAQLLPLLQTHLPTLHEKLRLTMRNHGRPSAFTRLWFPLLFVPPTLWLASKTVLKNRDWIKEQAANAADTIRGFVIQWVYEPVMGILGTVRGGGEGLGVAPTTVKSDQESLERMVMDLGRDYYHLSGPALEELQQKVRGGEMEAVLKVYEGELKSPLKNALMGSLIRTLLIQVQKTKTDLSLSLLSLDHLLRSQQLTFAFVGVAPSVLILYGIGGYLGRVWRGENRGKRRRMRYFTGLRDVERVLLTAPEDEAKMADRDRGLLILSVGGMRTWAAGLRGASRENFLDDLRMLEGPSMSRQNKLVVVQRIWRCWGIDGRKGPGV